MKSLLVRGIYHVKVSCFITFQSISNWRGEFFCSSISVTQIPRISQIARCFLSWKEIIHYSSHKSPCCCTVTIE